MILHYDTTLGLSGSDSVKFISYGNYVNSSVEWLVADSSLMHLDSLHLVELRALAAGAEHLRGTYMAQNVLNFFYDSLFFTVAQLPEELYAKKATPENSKNQINESARIVEGPLLKLYPNPAQNTITVEYSEIVAGSHLYIYNMVGVQQFDLILRENNGKLILDVSTYLNGIYLAKVDVPEQESLKSKFIVLK